MEQCLFCRIVNREVPATVVYEDQSVIAFNDIYPQAPIHIVIIPKAHYTSVLDVQQDDIIVSKIVNAANTIAKTLNVDTKGFRLINNCGTDGGQTIGHMHFHFLAGLKLQETLG